LTVIKTQTNPLVNKYLKQGKQLDSWEEYDGKVYCCSVPTSDGIIMVRRGGKNIWCGNSTTAQKGTIGMMYRHEDMPFTSEGIVPDIIINPLCIPSRMTINQIIECILGKKCCQSGEYGDSTPFTEFSKNVADKIINEIGENLEKYKFQKHGWETMYNGMTGEMINAKIFIGPTFYQRLKHMVKDKIYARSTGLMTALTRQPTEGRSREGGLRFGEMEKDAIVAYGASEVVNERLYTVSDEFAIYVCKKCGIISAKTTECQCKCDKIVKCKFPYASKLLLTELMSMGIKVTIRPGDE
jgi:DNA-directed RNA polymerase II subunit RPB2